MEGFFEACGIMRERLNVGQNITVSTVSWRHEFYLQHVWPVAVKLKPQGWGERHWRKGVYCAHAIVPQSPHVGCSSNGHSPVRRKTPWPPAIRRFSRISAVAAVAQHGNRAWQFCSAFPAVSIADATMW